MEICNSKVGKKLTVELKGELDHHAADRTRAALDELLKDESINEMILDMRNVSFMDSSGLGVVLGRYKTVSARGGKMAITGAGKSVDRIMRMAGVYALIERR